MEHMTESEKKLHRCCFTGHRPEKLHMSEKELTDCLLSEIRRAVQDGYTTFISGAARGVDIIAAELVLAERKRGMPIRLIVASPYKGFENRWKSDWQRRYSNVLQAADLVKYISPEYTPACFQKRNEWMVNHCSRVIAVYNGCSGGTRNTVLYAKRMGNDIRIIARQHTKRTEEPT